MMVTHGACGKSWPQAGNRTSHCGGCHETFASMGIFDTHRRDQKCIPAAQVKYRRQPLVQKDDGVWFSPAAVAAARAAFDKQEEE